ncbi:24934_t:CDS:2 [Entrophospora sp. SA101]|nr:24934_t:CDS:2 [Entrophospora sp. SA101]
MFDSELFELPKEEKEKRLKDDDIYVGGTKNLVVIVRKIPHGGPKINIDKGYFQAPMTREEKQSGHYMKRVINFFLKQENINPQQYEITLLSAIGVENFTGERKVAFGQSGGKSAGSTLYLALLSAFFKKPIAKEVASTGALSLSTKRIKWGKVSGQEFPLVPGTNLPIGGLKHKVSAATERGVNQLAEDYQQVVPPEIKAKMTVHFAENVAELRKLVLGGELNQAKAQQQRKANDLAVREEKIRLAQTNLATQKKNCQKEETRITNLSEKLLAKEKIITEQLEKSGQKEQRLEDKEQELCQKENQAQEILFARLKEKIKDNLDKQTQGEIKRQQEIVESETTKIICAALEKYSSELVYSRTVNHLKVDDDRHMGRIIGKDGRNINFFRKLTGVELLFPENGTARRKPKEGKKKEE